MEKMDTNADQLISYEEFSTAMKQAYEDEHHHNRH
jgi:hypothetical protein